MTNKSRTQSIVVILQEKTLHKKRIKDYIEDTH